jgi:hypothetical protein
MQGLPDHWFNHDRVITVILCIKDIIREKNIVRRIAIDVYKQKIEDWFVIKTSEGNLVCLKRSEEYVSWKMVNPKRVYDLSACAICMRPRWCRKHNC